MGPLKVGVGELLPRGEVGVHGGVVASLDLQCCDPQRGKEPGKFRGILLIKLGCGLAGIVAIDNLQVGNRMGGLEPGDLAWPGLGLNYTAHRR